MPARRTRCSSWGGPRSLVALPAMPATRSSPPTGTDREQVDLDAAGDGRARRRILILEHLFRGLNRGAGYRWQKFADQWETPCRLCSGVRRGGYWVNREDAHRSCWNELNRRQRRNRYVAIKSRSEATNYSPVVLIGHNCSRGTEPSVRAVNGSAPVPVFVSLHPQPLSTSEGTAL